jgi:citrate synthase
LGAATPAGTPAAPPFRPGLEGVPATQSAICDIDGLKGILSYRGYAVDDLAAQSSFLETAYLLVWGALPTASQLEDFQQEVQMHRRVSFRIRDMMKSFPSAGHPMDALQSSAASLGLFYSRRALDNPEYIYGAVVRLIERMASVRWGGNNGSTVTGEAPMCRRCTCTCDALHMHTLAHASVALALALARVVQAFHHAAKRCGL